MSFHHLQELLTRFKQIAPSDQIIKTSAEEAIQTVIGVSLSSKMMVYQNKILYIKAHPVIKGDILVKKKLLLQELQKSLGAEAPTDIK